MDFMLQDKPTNCGPVAIYNAFQWLGATEVELAFLEYTTEYGAYSETPGKVGIHWQDALNAFNEVQEYYNLRFEYAPYKSLFWEDIRYKLNEDSGLYLGYRNENNLKKKRNTLGHAVFLFTQGGKYYIVNDKKWTHPTLIQEVDAEHLKMLTEKDASGIFIRRTNEVQSILGRAS